ncbi:MAG: dihydrodipicolinate synthase family protein [Acidobacteria bacterium]|nr:dihydrodipicolinate synthase family protein [Acidobacteriota bacterium]
MKMEWKGVMPAMTTAFTHKLEIDHDFVAYHARWLVDNGCSGIITPGSLGEGNTLTLDERGRLWKTTVRSVDDRAPVIAAISSLSTTEAVSMAELARNRGCAGLMVLPPYVYKGDWREMKTHLTEVFRATPLPCMLYNNPVAYGTDFLPEQICELADENDNFAAVKESSTDLRRITAIRSLSGDRLALFVGVDDAIVEGIAAGAVGWVAGLVNALPGESVNLFNLAINGQTENAFELYRWFLPLLRLDTVPKFVQLIKLAQQEVGMGNERVRLPRMELAGLEREEALKLIRESLAARPTI